MEKDGGIPCVGPTLQHCNPQACGVSVSFQGTATVGGTNNGRRKRSGWAIFGKDDVKNILKEAFCDNIISGSIVTGSCDLQVLNYNTATGVAKYILSFEILDATALKKSLYDINKDIATNTAITGSGQSASPGRIGKFRNHPKVSLLGVVALLGDCTFIPAYGTRHILTLESKIIVAPCLLVF